MSYSDERKTPLKSFINNPSKSMWNLAIPIMVGMGIQTLYTIIDMIFIGRLGGDAIAAVAFNMPIFFFVMGLSFGLGNGVTASIARFIGAEDKKNGFSSIEKKILHPKTSVIFGCLENECVKLLSDFFKDKRK
jgi:Na+-driven multidrug efflux pump